MKRIGILIGWLVWTAGVSAQSWSLDDCMKYAVEHATEVKREVVNARQRKQDYQHAVAGFLPTVSGGVQGQYAWGRNIDPETNTYNNVTTFNNYYQLYAELNVFDGFATINALKQAKLSRDYSATAMQKIQDDRVINDLSDFKVQAQVDEHYIDRVKPGLTATFDQNGKHYLLQVRKVYPEVRDGRFRIDFIFKGVRPGNIRTGQTYYVDLQLGQSKQAIIIPKGTFYSVTGGQWIFVLDKSGKKAYRRKITIGRQNPQYYEVIEGLEPGEQVIVSGYEAYKDNDVLVFN